MPRRVPTILACLAAALVAAPGSAAAAGPPLSASVVGEPPNGGGVFRFPQALAFTPGGATVFVGDEYSGVIQAFDAAGRYRFSFGARASRRERGRLGVVGGAATDRSGHVYVLDSENERVQVFSADDGRSLAAWGDSRTFDLLDGIAEDGVGISAGGLAVDQRPGGPPVVYVADQGKDRVARFVLDPGTLTPVGSPTFTPAALGLDAPQGVALDPAGARLYVADDDNDRVVVLDPVSLAFVTQAGSRGTGPGQFRNPYDVAVDSRQPPQLYVADNLNNRIDVFDATTLASTRTFGSFGRPVGLFAIVRAVGAVADDPRGGVTVADTANNRVQSLDADGGVTAAWGLAGRGPGYATRPRDVAFAAGGSIAVADAFDHRIARFDPDGTYTGQLGLVSPATGFAAPGDEPGQFELPSGVAYDPFGVTWVADTGNDRVQGFNPDGTLVRTVGVQRPGDVAADPAGGALVTSGTQIVRVSPDGSSAVIQSGLVNAAAVAHDGTTVYVADDTRVLRGGAAVAPPPGESAWDHPDGLAVDPASRTLYVSERRLGQAGGARVLRGTPAGSGYEWETIATEGTGDGQVIEPAGLAVSGDGRTLLIADEGGNRVLRLDAPGASPPVTAELTTSVDAITLGQVTSDPPGIACATDCTQRFGLGRTVTLTASPVAGATFTGWTGACLAAGTSPTCAIPAAPGVSAGAGFAPGPPLPAPVITAPPPPPPPPAVRLSAARLRPATLHRARRADKKRKVRARKATRARLTFTLSRPANVTLGLAVGRDGVRAGSECVARSRAPKSATRRCTRFVVLKVSRTIRRPAGAGSTVLVPTFGGRALVPGHYRLLLSAVDTAANRIGPILVGFRVAVH